MLRPADILKMLTGAVLVLAASIFVLAATPKLNIKTKHGNEMELRKRDQMEKLARQHDLTKYTLTRDIMIEQGAMNHSMPVLTLNLRFLDNDDLALSAYIHEQGHWVLAERHRMDLPALYDDLQRRFPGLPTQPPEGSNGPRDSYFHLVVCTLEWQGLEDLIGPERARRVIEWKKGDHYIAIYETVLQHRDVLEALMHHYGIRF